MVGGEPSDHMTRAEKVWDIRRRCIRANSGVLWNDHGDILKRVIRQPGTVQGRAVLTKIMLVDVLKTWEWIYEKTADRRDDDKDAADVFREIAHQIEALWDRTADDLTQQSDKVIDLLADRLLVEVPRAKRKRA
jgi:hypothetical protein